MSPPNRADIDTPLIVIAWMSTVAIASFSVCIRQKRELVNAVFAVVFLAALIAFAFVIGRSLFDVPLVLYQRVFDGTYRRCVSGAIIAAIRFF